MQKKPLKAVPPEFTDGIIQLNAGLDGVAAELARLRAANKDQMTPAEKQQFNNDLQALVTRVNGMKIDPDNPPA